MPAACGRRPSPRPVACSGSVLRSPLRVHNQSSQPPKRTGCLQRRSMYVILKQPPHAMKATAGNVRPLSAGGAARYPAAHVNLPRCHGETLHLHFLSNTHPHFTAVSQGEASPTRPLQAACRSSLQGLTRRHLTEQLPPSWRYTGETGPPVVLITDLPGALFRRTAQREVASAPSGAARGPGNRGASGGVGRCAGHQNGTLRAQEGALQAGVLGPAHRRGVRAAPAPQA